MTRKLAVWMTLMALLTTSCSTTMNIRREDYHRIDPERTYHVVMADSSEYDVKKLVVERDVATFTRNGQRMTVPVEQIMVIQQVNKREVLKVGIGLGIVSALIVGLIVWLEPD
jgi:hypothetical protein